MEKVIIYLFFFSTITMLSCEISNSNSAPNKDNFYIKNIEHENSPSKVVGAPMPTNLFFCDEKINVQDLDIKERLDRELTGNMYFHSKMQSYFKRANRWFPIIEPILKEKKIPDDFKYLAITESGLTQAISPSGAKGFWQFMPKTSKDYNLEINEYIDERYNVEKSTYAACDYLNNAYYKFKNWVSAAASYNIGKAGLQNQMEKQYSNNYFDLKLNNETARYIFRLLAIKTIMENPKKYGFYLQKKDLFPVYKTKHINISNKIENVALWAKQNNLNYKIIKKLNPWILKNTIPASSTKEYSLLIPDSTTLLKPMKKYEQN